MSIKGFKVFNPDWTCRNYDYKNGTDTAVGTTHKHNGNIEMCGKGFHFCQVAADCFDYYRFNSNNKVAEVEAIGLVETEGNKSVTDEIKIIREISWQEVLTIVNTGKDCTGLRNTGNWNTGYWNTGNGNTGNRNTGNGNTGNWNTGNWNTGDRNTGDWNTGDWNTGFFCTTSPKIFMFEKPTDFAYYEARNLRGIEVLNWNFENSWWIYSENMTDEEKKAHPEHEITGGYLKTVDLKAACKNMWDNLCEKDKQAVKDLPNFDAKIFKEITGIEV